LYAIKEKKAGSRMIIKHQHWPSQKFWLGRPKLEKNCDVILVT